MNKTGLFALSCAVAVALAAPASALEWTTMGAQSMGMGGAGVADAQGPLAAYWNPAALGRPSMNSYGLAIPVSVQADVQGSIIAGAKDLQQCSGGSCTTAQINNALGELRGGGINADVGGGASLKVGKFTAFLNGYMVAGVGAGNIDFVNNTPGSVTNNTSNLTVRAAQITELGLGYGHELPWVPGLYVGGDVKAMRADVGYGTFNIVGSNGVGSNTFSAANNTTPSGNVGIDAGALWDLDKTYDGVAWSPRLGLTGRNLNNPKFDNPASAAADGVSGKFSINPTVRSGLSFSPENWWHFAADADLTRNLTPLDGYASQEVGGGTEIDVFNRSWINIPLRVGIKHNLAQASDGATFTAGTGLNFLHFMIDASGEVGNQSIVIQNQGNTTRIPREVGGAVQLSFLFGGSEENHHRHEGSDADVQPVTSDRARADMSPSAADKVRADADKAQQELNSQPAGN